MDTNTSVHAGNVTSFISSPVQIPSQSPIIAARPEEEAEALLLPLPSHRSRREAAINDSLFLEEPSGEPLMPSRIERDFLAHSAKHGWKLLAMMAEAMDKREHSEPCGCDSLPKHLRFAHPDRFKMHNNFAPWYVAALVILRPDLSDKVIHDHAKVERLRELNWQLPSLQGVPRHD